VGTELSFLSPRDWRPVPGLKAEVVGVEADGVRLLQIQGDLLAHLEEVGEVPLPPYIKAQIPLERYQTVYAKRPGSVAAPTAGLHFTPELLERLREMGVELHFLTLHVGPGTFRPVKGDPEKHAMHAEPYEIPEATALGGEPGQGRGEAGHRRGHHGGAGPGERLPGRGGGGGGGGGDPALHPPPLRLQGHRRPLHQLPPA
jgi:S-adenosylmethionine:tRNA ribosyltransferase-isomerase